MDPAARDDDHAIQKERPSHTTGPLSSCVLAETAQAAFDTITSLSMSSVPIR
ncbi:hypothetical protein GGD64_006146 [Bradyrhizobium sp. CIR3A]|nr:hypothetical protein [Bradyrhizobium sp. CIR3A]NYG45675.1 hypothetical protein [Bradyrhizobium sp. IAR9]